MTLRLMRIFRSVAEHKSFSRAAEELDITRPAVSQAITQLEEYLLVKLFNRTTRRVDLTPEGELYYHHAVDILERMGLMEEQLQKPFEGPVGRIRVIATPSVARSYLLPLVVSFQKAYPHIEILVETYGNLINFSDSAIDFALLVGDNYPQDLESQVLADVHFVCCASAEYIAEHGEPKNLEDLEKHKAVNYFSNNTGRTHPWRFMSDDGIRYVRMNHDVAVTDADSAVAYTLAGKGISVFSLFLAEPYLESGELVQVLNDYPIASRPLRLLNLPNKTMNQRLKLFYEWLIHADNKPDVRNYATIREGNSSVIL